MDLTPYVDTLRRELAVAAEAGGDEARELAERLTAPLESATRLTMLNVLSAAMDEITRELAPGSVDVRLRGLDPDFVVTPPPADGGARGPARARRAAQGAGPGARPTATRAAPPASICACPPTSRRAPRRPRAARACRSTRGWCGPCRPRSTAAPGRVRRRRPAPPPSDRASRAGCAEPRTRPHRLHPHHVPPAGTTRDPRGRDSHAFFRHSRTDLGHRPRGRRFHPVHRGRPPRHGRRGAAPRPEEGQGRAGRRADRGHVRERRPDRQDAQAALPRRAHRHRRRDGRTAHGLARRHDRLLDPGARRGPARRGPREDLVG